MIMPTIRTAFVLFYTMTSALAGEAEVKAAQTVIDSQLQAFIGDREDEAYAYAAPSIKRMFPTVDAFMGMVKTQYPMVHKPSDFSFGRAEEMGARIAQQVMILGPDGKDYEALYTLELQADGTWLITGVSLRGANTLST